MSLQKNTVSNYLAQGYVALVGLAFVPVYVDQLGVEAYGLIGFYIVLQTWFALLDLGMTPTIIRESSRFKAGLHTPESIGNLVRSLEIIVFLLAFAIAIGLWAASGPISTHWLRTASMPKEVVDGALAAIAVVVAARFCEGIYRGVLFGLERQVFYNAVFASLTTVRHGGAAILVIFIPSIEVFFWWQAALSIVTVLVLGLAAYAALPRPSRGRSFSLESLQGVGSFAGGMSLTALFALLFTQADKVILTRIVDLESFGYYMLAFAIVIVFPMMASPAAAAFFPRLSAAVSTGDTFAEQRLFHSGVQIVSIFAAPALIMCVMLGNEILLAWTGDPNLAQKVSPILWLVAIGAFCNAVLQIPFMLQLAHGWTTLSVRINLLGVVLLIPIVYLATEMYGIQGAAAGWAITNVLVAILATFTMHQRIMPNELFRFLRNSILLPLLASAFAVWICMLLIYEPVQSRFESLVAVLLGGSFAVLGSTISLPLGREILLRVVERLSGGIRRSVKKTGE